MNASFILFLFVSELSILSQNSNPHNWWSQQNCSVCCNRNLSCLFQPFLFFIVIPLIAFCYFRGVRLVNPFYSIWASPQGVTMGRAFIGVAMAAGILYFIILMVFIIKAIYNIWQRRKQFKSMAKGLRIHYMVCFIFKHFVLLYF